MDECGGADERLGRLRNALSAAAVPHADIYFHRVQRGFARFSLNTLNQHAETDEGAVTARVGIPSQDGYRLASVSTTDRSHEGLVTALRRASAIAANAAPVLGWPGFAPAEGETPAPPRFAAPTARCTAAARAERLAPALARAREAGLTAAGALETSVYETAVVNTEGVARYATGTFATFKVFALDPDRVSGFAQATHRDIDCIDAAALAAEACDKARAGSDPVALPAGEYDVILEPPAVAELIEWLNFIAVGAREVADGTSPLAGHQGKRITGSDVTLVDDALDASELGFGRPFDRDGIVRQRVVVIEGGIARGPVYNLLYGARMGHPSTGHAAPPGGFGDAPIAQALSLAGGDETLEGLTRKVRRGLHITRLHYVNGFLEPRRSLMTGLTRDGTFLIEHGARGRGVRNMRFTDSVLEAFARLDGLTSWRAAVPAWWSDGGAFVVPAVLIRRLRFTSGGTTGPAAAGSRRTEDE